MPIEIGYHRQVGKPGYNAQIYGASSIIGGRKKQEDDYLLVHTRKPGEPTLLAVFDGVGGQEGGGIASKKAAETLGAKTGEILGEQLGLVDALKEAHNRIKSEFSKSRSTGGATTVAAGLVKEGMLTLAHAGDSKIGVVRGMRLVWLTREHTVAQVMVDAGLLQPNEVSAHPAGNSLTTALGIPVEPGIELSKPFKLEAEDRIIACTDGVWRVLSDEEIAGIVRGAQTAKHAADGLTYLVEQRKGNDNATAIVYFHKK